MSGHERKYYLRSMSEILDEHLLRRQRRKDFLCRRFRTITLVFAGTMILLYFIFGMQHWQGRDYLLGAGLISILLQTLACYAVKENRNIGDTIRVLIMAAFTIYLLHNRGMI